MAMFLTVTHDQLFSELPASIVNLKEYTPTGLRLLDVCKCGYGGGDAPTPRIIADGLYIMDTALCDEGQFVTRNSENEASQSLLNALYDFLDKDSSDLIDLADYWDYESWHPYGWEEPV